MRKRASEQTTPWGRLGVRLGWLVAMIGFAACAPEFSHIDVHTDHISPSQRPPAQEEFVLPLGQAASFTIVLYDTAGGSIYMRGDGVQVQSRHPDIVAVDRELFDPDGYVLSALKVGGTIVEVVLEGRVVSSFRVRVGEPEPPSGTPAWEDS